MALPFVLTSSDSFTGSTPYNRFKGLILSGQIADGGSGGPASAPPGGIACIQSTASLATQIITATGQPPKSAFVYIPQGTLAVSSSSSVVGAAPPYTGIGAALYFDITRKKLSIFSTGVGEWVSVTLSSS